MATINSAAAGDWHLGTTWAGGVVPGAGDEAVVTHLLTTVSNIVVGSVTFNGSGNVAIATALDVTVSGIIGGATTPAAGFSISHTVGTVNISAAAIHANYQATIIDVIGPGQVNLITPLLSMVPSSGVGEAVQIAAGGNVAIHGPGGTKTVVDGIAGTTGITIRMVGASTLVIDGSVEGNDTTPAIKIEAAGCSLTINGDISTLASTGTAGNVISTSFSGMINITGDVHVGPMATAISCGSTTDVYLLGDISTQGTVARGVTTNGSLTFGGNMNSYATAVPFMAASVSLIEGYAFTWRLLDTDGNAVVLSNLGGDEGLPDPRDVRSGTIYGISSTLTGACDVPTSDQVAAGVPVDAVTGTAVLRATDLAAYIGAALEAANP